MSQNRLISSFISWSKDPFKLLFFGILIAYIYLYAPYGLENGDMGSIFGISWSIYNGYVPHVDFYYIKPAFPPFFHSLILHITEDYAYLFNRGFYYVQVFSFAWLTIDLLKTYFKSLVSGSVYFLATLAAIVTIHNYPPMPWNTIDGVFFSVIGLYILLKKDSWYWIALAAICISCGVLSKQSFYFMPIFISGYLIWIKAYKKLSFFIGFGLICALLCVGILMLLNAWDPFIAQTFSFTSGGSFLEAGFKNYLRAAWTHIPQVVLGIGGLWALKKYVTGALGFLITCLAIAGYLIALYLGEDSYHTVKAWLFQTWFLVAVGYVAITFINTRKKQYALLLLLLCLSWCASISNGFKTPISYAVPLVVTVYVYFFEAKTMAYFKPVAPAVLGVFLITFFIGYQSVYNDSNRSQLTYNMGEIFPRLSGIKSDLATYTQYQELKFLDKKYTNYTILPSMTLGHYVTNTKNPIGVDWVFNHHLADDIDKHAKLLEDNNVTVFLEPFENHNNDYENSSLLTVYIKEHWQEIDRTPYFRVYQKRSSD